MDAHLVAAVLRAVEVDEGVAFARFECQELTARAGLALIPLPLVEIGAVGDGFVKIRDLKCGTGLVLAVPHAAAEIPQPAGRGDIRAPYVVIALGALDVIGVDGRLAAIAVKARVKRHIVIWLTAVRGGIDVAQIVLETAGLFVHVQRRTIGVLCPAEKLIVLCFLAEDDSHKLPSALGIILAAVDEGFADEAAVSGKALRANQDRAPGFVFRADEDGKAPELELAVRVEAGKRGQLFKVHGLCIAHGVGDSLKAAVGPDHVPHRLFHAQLRPEFGVVPHAAKGRVIPDRCDGIGFGRFIEGGGRFLGRLLRVGQEAHGHDHRCEHRREHEPEGRLFVVENGLDARFDARLAEGQRARRNEPSRDAARKKRLGIRLFAVRAERADDLFIACGLDIAAEQHICQPAQRIEPVGREEQEAERLPQLIAAL